MTERYVHEVCGVRFVAESLDLSDLRVEMDGASVAQLVTAALATGAHHAMWIHEHLDRFAGYDTIRPQVFDRGVDLTRDSVSDDSLRVVDMMRLRRDIAGALKCAVDAHGPMTRDLIGSAAKRVYGAIRSMLKEDRG